MSEPPTIRVEATGTASARPDLVRVTLFTFAEDFEPAVALTAASRLCEVVLSALRGAGVADTDLVTTAIDLGEQHRPREGESGRAYRASTTIVVTVREPEAVGRTVAAAVGAAGTGVGVANVAFDVDDRAPLVSLARRRAVADALAAAGELADAAGLRLGRVLQLAEGGSGVRPLYGRPVRMALARTASGGPTPPPVELGELSVSVGVTAEFEVVAPEA